MDPRTLSHFEILEELGSGGMGEVYLARDLRLHRMVALKTLPRSRSVSEEARRRLLAEARAASSLNHEAIVTIYEVGSEDEVDYIAMEHVEGRSLAQVLAEEGPLDPERVRRFAVVLAEALSAAHAAGVIHRDLKPANVMVTAGDRLKILDFGLAKRTLLAESGSTDEMPTVADPVVTAKGVLLGTPAYMAPEQASGRLVDPRTDLFALGAILYEMLTGHRAFAGATALEVVSAVLRDRPPAPSTVREAIRSDWDPVIARLLAKDPADRHPDAAALVGDLESIGRRSHAARTAKRVVLLAAASLSVVLVLGVLLRETRTSFVGPEPADEGWGGAFPEYTFRLLADLPGSQRDPVFSPDGELVAFVQEDGKGVPQIWVTGSSGDTPRQVTSGETPAGHPAWDPVGDAIVFDRGGDGIWDVSSTGGEPRRLLAEGSKPSVSPDGLLLSFVDQRRPWTARRGGGDPRPLAGFEVTHFGHLAYPAFAPDSRRVVTFWPHPNRPLGDLWIAPIEGGAPARITDLRYLSWDSRPLWTADGDWIVFSSDHEGPVNLWRVSATGGAPIPVTRGAGSDYGPDVTSNLERLIYANGRNLARIEVYAPVTGVHRTAYERRDLLIAPEVSPDGTRAAFFARGRRAFRLFVVDLATGDVRQVTEGAGEVDSHPVWSADGEWLYFYQQEPGLSYRRVRAAGGESEELLTDWAYPERNRARPSPDGRRVVYTFRDAGQLVEARIRDLESGQERALPLPLYDPQWSRDGRHVYGATWRPYLVHRCPVEPGPCETLTEGWDARLSADESTLYVLRGGPPVVWAKDLVTGKERQVHEIEGYDSLDFGWGIGPAGEIVHHAQHAGELELWIGEAREASDE